MEKKMTQSSNHCRRFAAVMAFVALLSVGCQRETKVLENTVTDVDNNSYPAAKIGKHIWMLQDLKTFRFADYTMMDDVHTQGSFDMLLAATLRHHQYPAYNKGSISYMKNTNTPNLGPCPQGWHVPSVAEWEDLIQTVSKRSDWVEKSLSVNGAMVADPESPSRCEFLNASSFNAVLDRSGFIIRNGFKDLTPESHYSNYKCYWALDEGDLSADSSCNCTYVEFSHPSLDNPSGESKPEVKKMKASEEDGQPAFFVRCVKDK
jgi:uncharacterized protein (TIGR02145 family)